MLKKKPPSQNAGVSLTPTTRKVTFKREIRKKNISPLSDKPEGVRRMPEDFNAPEHCSISFVEITDNSIMSSGVKLAPIFSIGRPQKRSAPVDSQPKSSSRRRRTLDGTSSLSLKNVLPPTQLPERKTPKIVKPIVFISDDEDEVSIVTEVNDVLPATKKVPLPSKSKMFSKTAKMLLDYATFTGLIHCNAPTFDLPESSSPFPVEFDAITDTLVDKLKVLNFHSRSLKRYLYTETEVHEKRITVKKDMFVEIEDSADKNYFKAGCKRRAELGKAAAITPWVDAFAPHNRNEFIKSNIQNFEDFRTWLHDWSRLMDELAKIEADPPNLKKPKLKSRRNKVDDEDYAEERPFKEDLANTFILFGPTGCGKTSAVYVFGQKAGFNIVEVSVSDLRSGSVLKKRLSETIKSFAIKRTGGIASFFSPKPTKSEKVEKANNSGVQKNIVLIDDADVVLSPDKFYWAQLIESCVESRIPIVMTASNNTVFMNNFSKSDLLIHHIHHRIKGVVVSHLQHWLSGFSEIPFTKDFVKQVVEDHPEDIRRAVGQIEFLSGFKFVPKKRLESTLSPTMLADFDSFLGQLDATAQRSNQCRWPAVLRNSETFKPRVNSEGAQVYSYPDPDDSITQYLRSTINSRRPSCYEKFDKRDANLIRFNGMHSDNPPSPIEPAIIDCFNRVQPPISTSKRAIVLDELPALGLINRAFKKRIASGISSRRVLHVFNDVNLSTGLVIDCQKELYKSIQNYYFPDFNPDQTVNPESEF